VVLAWPETSVGVTPELLADARAAPAAAAPEPRLQNSRLKITYVLGSLRDGGTERQVLELVRRLDRDRFEPSLMLMEDANADQSRGLVERCVVLGIPQGGNSRWFFRSTSLAKAVLRARGYLQDLRSDIVHAFLPGPCILGGMAARLARIPLIIGSRRSLPSRYRAGRWTAGWADTAAFNLAHFNLGNSCAVTREMIEIAGCPAGKCGTVHNGVDLQRFRPDVASLLRQQLGWSRDDVVFGQVANLHANKRCQDFVEMAAMLIPRHPQARFLLAGADYGAKPSILRQIDALGLGAQVRVLSGSPSPEAIFAALDVYVCTSEAEGFSNAILEAMACGKPVIATAVGGTPEAVRHDQSGFLVPAGDVPALAERADALLADARLRTTMGMNGRRRAEANFSLAAMVESHQELYGRLFQGRMRRVT
jgi:glycosyltransferase involved in cell wall biosynthesis